MVVISRVAAIARPIHSANALPRACRIPSTHNDRSSSRSSPAVSAPIRNSMWYPDIEVWEKFPARWGL